MIGPLALLLATAAPAPDGAGDAQRIGWLNAAAERLGSAHVRPVTIGAQREVAALDGEELRVRPDVLGFIETRAEALALTATLEAYAEPAETERPGHDLPAQIAAGAAAVGAMALAGSDYQRRYAQDLSAGGSAYAQPENSAPDAPPPIGRVRAARILARLDAAGGCSGALVRVLDRMSGFRPASPEGAPVADFARRALRDLGGSVMPADDSCLGSG